MLVEKHRSLLGGDSEQPRWVVLDPQEASLSLWDHSIREASNTLGGASSPPQAKAPRKIYSMEKLVEVDSNPTFRNIHLCFEGDYRLHLVAELDEEFRRWMDAFEAYDISQDSTQGLSTGKSEARPLQRGGDCGPPSEPCSPKRTRSPKPWTTPRGHQHSSCSFRNGYDKCYVVEPNPEPSPGFEEICEHEDYDTGSMEQKAVMPSMGIMDHKRGLTPR